MPQFLLFVGTLAAIFAIVPVCTLLATGSARQAWEAAKGYAVVWGLIAAAAAVLAVCELVAVIVNS